ncbi:MAG TPA: cytochrome C oxidase subunit II [Candidatus Angelobacter sp.]|jgi:cytochrome c oxidase subunit 2
MSAALRLALLLILAGCIYLFLAQPYWFPVGASLQAAAIDHQFKIAFWVLGGMFVAGHLVLVFVLAKKTHAGGKPLRGGWKLEVTWTVAITAIFFWLHVSGNHLSLHAKTVMRVGSLQEIEVTGAQFEWYFRYPGADGTFGRTSAQKFARPDEGNPLGIDPADPAGRDDIVSSSLVVPIGQPVVLRLKAQDVIHSLFIPAMRFKQDAVPGMDIRTSFTPDKMGTYEIVCSQLCGIGHYRMRAAMRVVTEEEFEVWLGNQQKAVAQGEQ